MRELQRYVQTYLKDELAIIKRDFADALPNLTDEEKTILYKYSDDGFYVNERLREKPNDEPPEFAVFLDAVLAKLPNFTGTVYRGVKLSQYELKRYQDAAQDEAAIIESAFLSCSSLATVARQYGAVIFTIRVKNGKIIENTSKFGSGSSQNEHEILLPRGTQLRIFSVFKINNYITITAEEV